MPPRADRPKRSRRKLIEFDAETWHALHRLSQDSLKSLQDLADEAFRDLLRKHGRPATLKEALRESARRLPGQRSVVDARPARSAALDRYAPPHRQRDVTQDRQAAERDLRSYGRRRGRAPESQQKALVAGRAAAGGAAARRQRSAAPALRTVRAASQRSLAGDRLRRRRAPRLAGRHTIPMSA